MLVLIAVGFLASILYPWTVFAPTYSPQAFQKIRLGMSREEVRELIGEPLIIRLYGRRTPGLAHTVEFYSRPVFRQGNYFESRVNYDDDGHVLSYIVTSDERTYFFNERETNARFWKIGPEWFPSVAASARTPPQVEDRR